ncbi:MAG: DUF4921 family protein [Gemmataceae bacterium]|nr:DUF4921 family protein [Gemmataceae bacterium]
MTDDTAPEFRRDPVTGRWVVVAPERAARPMALRGAEPRHRPDRERKPCPFCPGQEHDTPHEVYALRDPGTAPDGPGWRLRVVPNKFPVARAQDPSPRPPPPGGEGEKEHGRCSAPPPFPGEGAGGRGLFRTSPASGRHEVVVETADHLADPAALSDGRLAEVFVAYRERLVALAADPALTYAAVFKNVGAEAGASLGHTHSQILATPLVPDLVRRELAGSAEYHAANGRCVFCDIVAHELADRSRVVAETPGFVAVTAFAGRFAYEVWVLPKHHTSRYEAITDDAAGELAALMRRVAGAMDAVLAEPAYNWYLHTAPLRAGDLPHYHWHWEILPRTSRPAGLEWGSGCFVSAVPPERAAAELRASM